MKTKPKQKRCITCNRVLGGKKTKYCDELCRNKHWNSREIRRVHQEVKRKTCLNCHSPLTPRQSKFCKRSCGITYRRRRDAKLKERYNGKCIVCKKELTGRQTKFCSWNCNSKYYFKWVAQEKKDLQRCLYCKAYLKFGIEHRRFCSRECRIANFQMKNGVKPLKARGKYMTPQGVEQKNKIFIHGLFIKELLRILTHRIAKGGNTTTAESE